MNYINPKRIIQPYWTTNTNKNNSYKISLNNLSHLTTTNNTFLEHTNFAPNITIIIQNSGTQPTRTNAHNTLILLPITKPKPLYNNNYKNNYNNNTTQNVYPSNNYITKYITKYLAPYINPYTDSTNTLLHKLNHTILKNQLYNKYNINFNKPYLNNKFNYNNLTTNPNKTKFQIPTSIKN